jgi:adenylate cyclase
MELYYADQVDEFAGLIAYHYEQADRPLEAAKYYERAASWVGALHASQAIRHWRKVRALLERLSPTEEADRMHATAGAKIAVLGWREGMTLAEVKPLIDEAQQFATKGDDRMMPWLCTMEGRMLVASGGPADAYVDLAKKSLLYIDVDRDLGRVAAAHASLCQAYSWAGLLREALQANDVALAYAHHVDAYERAFFGFSIEQWVLSLRSRLLSRMGRVGEARECLDRMLHVEASSREPPVPGMSRVGFVELAWAMEDAQLAHLHARELPEVAEKYGTPYLRAFALGYSGIAASIAGRFDDALDDYMKSLKVVRETGAAREYEPELLASIAECHLKRGDPERAHASATEAIDLSRLRTTRVAECRSLIARAEAALATGLPDAEQDLADAQQLLALTGATVCRAGFERARGLSAARAA